MEDERDGPDSERTDADDEPSQRDLGLGHPLSPEDSAEFDESAEAEPADGESRSTDERSEPAGEASGLEAGGQGSSDGDGSGVSRRELLFGAAGAVTASLGWAGVRMLGGGGGPDGAEGVAVDYVNAIADNDWAAAGATFHSESGFGQSDLSYEEFLQNRSQPQFETYSSIEPSVESHHTFAHITDPEQAAQSEDVLTGLSSIEELDPEEIEESKQIAVIASVRSENLNRTEAQREFLGDGTTVGFTITVVRDEAGWQIVQVFGGTTV